MNARRFLSCCLIFVPLIIALLLVLPISGIPVSPDGAWYSGLALNLYNGHGYTDLDGTALFTRPLFPTILTAAYYLFGPSPLSSLVVLRLFYLLTVLLVTLLARSLYGAWTGSVAGLLVVSSYALNEWSTWVNLDPILPAFILLFLLLFQIALRGYNKLLFILAGVALALALLVKETALLFFGLPLLVLIFRAADRSRRQIFVGALLTWFASFLMLLPWLWYVVTNTGDPRRMLGSTPQWASRTLVNLTASESLPTDIVWWEFVQAFLNRVQNFLNAFPNFYEWHLVPNFVLAPLLLFAFLLVCAASSRLLTAASPLAPTLHANRYLALSVLTFTPMIVLQGVAGFRARQSIIVFLLLMIALAWLVTIPLQWYIQHQWYAQNQWWSQLPAVASASNSRRRFFNYAFFGLALVPAIMLVSWQACCDRPFTMADHLRNFNSLAALTQPVDMKTVRSPNRWWPTDSMIRSSRSFATWADNAGLAVDQRILTHDNHHRYLNLFTAGTHHYFRIPTLPIGPEERQANEPPLHLVLLNAIQPNSVLWQNVGKDEPSRFTGLRAYTQEQILATVADEQIDYVVVGHPEKWLATYFLSHPDFQKVAEFEYGTTHLFEVTNQNPQPIDLPPTIDKDAAHLLKTLRKSEPERYAQLADSLFVAQLGWTPEETNAAIADGGTLAIQASGFSYPQYVQWVDSIFGHTDEWENNGVLAIQQAKEAHESQNPWPQIALGMFYQQQGLDDGNLVVNYEMITQAVDAYQQALRLDSENWRAAWHVTELHRVREEVVDDELLASALPVYQNAIKDKPNSERTFRQMARMYMQLERPMDATEIYRQAIESGVADAGTYLSLGWIHQSTLADIDTAIEIYTEGIAIMRPDDPKYDRLIQHLGKHYTAQGEIDLAVALYEKAAYERVGAAWPHVELGKLYLDAEYSSVSR